MRIRPIVLIATLIAALLGVVACSDDTPATPSGPATAPSVTIGSDAATPPKSSVGDLGLGDPIGGASLQVPFLLWGGDMATFYANGGLETTSGSIMAEEGLNVKLVPGDDFSKQVEAYKSGASPFLRGTFRMIGLASEQLGTDPGARPKVFMQMTWSAGDHLVARGEIKNLGDLKGKSIAVQKGGPHVGMLDDVLKTANLKWSDVTVTWVDNITGPGSAAELFRSNGKIDAAFAITPDMLGLTGGVTSEGSGAEGTVKGARVAVSTSELSHSIADVYAVRSDFWDKNPEKVKQFTAGYLRAVEKVIDMKNAYESSGSDSYMGLLKLSQDIYGSDVIPTLEEDAHGLLSDCSFVGQPGNVSFFTDPRNLHGFTDFNERSQDLAVALGEARKRTPLQPSPIDWSDAAITSKLKKLDGSRAERFQAEAVLSEVEQMDADGLLDSRTLLSFTINFAPNQTAFDAKNYREEYNRLLELAARYGNAAVVIRGHSDTTLVLRDAVMAGLETGKLKRTGSKGDYTYYLDGKPLDLENTAEVVKAIQSNNTFRAGGQYDPRKTVQAALKLSRERALAVRESVIGYATEKGVPIDESQIQAQGVGVREPLLARPSSPEEAALNMRVEFRLVRVSAEAMSSSDFDF